MAGEWTVERFDRMAQLVRDPIHPSEALGLPYIGLEHIGEGSLSLIGSGVAEDATSLKSRFKQGDILFGKLRPYFRKVIRAPFAGICSTDIWVVRPRAGIEPGFLFYLMASDRFVEPVVRASEGTKMPRAKWEYACALDHPLPPLPEQRAIAHILGTLDDKIELNRRMNETLEAMARALFKSWFVDFDPVKAKAEGRDPGLPKEIADLFPDKLVESELGDIPEGWRVGSVDDEFNLTMGQSPPGSTYNEEGTGLPFYQGRTDFGFRFPTQRVFCTAPTRLAAAGDTLISVRAPVGDVNVANEECAIGRGVAAARHKSGSRAYTYQFMRSIKSVFDTFEAEGTVFGSIGKKDFHSIKCVLPPRELVAAFEQTAGTLDENVFNFESESRTLVQLRDTLLPKLISGELRVGDADRFVGEVAS